MIRYLLDTNVISETARPNPDVQVIAKSQDLGVATRNVAHFRGFGVPVYDPFSNVHTL